MIHIMLPAQYASRSRLAEPHERLMAAVLRAAVDDCRGGTSYRRATGNGVVAVGAVRKAVAYVISTDRTWPFSFENVCEALGLDTVALRRKLLSDADAAARVSRFPHTMDNTTSSPAA
jgi:hypothetical protein